METNDGCWRKRSSGFLPIPAESDRMESHFLFPCVWPVFYCPSSISILVKWPDKYTEGVVWSLWTFKHTIRRNVAFPPNHTHCLLGWEIAETAGLFRATERTLTESCHDKHAGRARGARVNAQARWSPRARSRFGTSSTWTGHGVEDQWNLCSFHFRTMTPLLMLVVMAFGLPEGLMVFPLLLKIGQNP